MALTATIYNFDIELSDTDRHVYESLTLRVARHPSESEEYLVARVIAYLLEFTEGIEFSWRSVRSSRVSNVAWSSVCQSATANCTCPLARTNLPCASSDCIEKNDEGESKDSPLRRPPLRGRSLRWLLARQVFQDRQQRDFIGP
jgi:hypothetical protein